METDDGYVIARKAVDGSVAQILMTPDELNGLHAKISFWTGSRLQSRRGLPGSAQAVIAHPAQVSGVALNALEDSALLTLESPAGGDMTLSIPIESVEPLIQALSELAYEAGQNKRQPS
jgi:hypothetical protein